MYRLANAMTDSKRWTNSLTYRLSLQQSALYFFLVIIQPTIAYAIISSIFGFTALIINMDLVLVYLVAVALFRLSPIASATVATLAISFAISVQVLLGLGFIYLEDPALVIEYFSFLDLWLWKLILIWGVLPQWC
jgi:hypothetical protein